MKITSCVSCPGGGVLTICYLLMGLVWYRGLGMGKFAGCLVESGRPLVSEGGGLKVGNFLTCGP